MLPAKTLPPSSDSFADMSVGKRHSKVVASYGHWNVQFHQQDPGLVKFNYTLPTGASVAIYGRRNSVPTHTRYDFVEILSARDRRHRKAAKVGAAQRTLFTTKLPYSGFFPSTNCNSLRK